MKAYILSGIPGSGKSTYARGTWPGAVICSADDYFMQNGVYRHDVTKLNQAHGACFRNFVEALQENAPIVVCDNTNTRVEEIAPYVLAAQAYGYEHEIVTCHCDIETAAKRGVHDVPSHVLWRMFEAIKNRSLPPWWNETKKGAY